MVHMYELLNSSQLIANVIGQIARELDLPTAESLEETRQILDRKLVEMGREPRNVQVNLEEMECGWPFISETRAVCF